MKPETIKIDEVEYVRKDAVPEVNAENYAIVRSTNAGVFAGEIAEKNLAAGWVKMTRVRRIWYWSGAASLSQLAADGVSNPGNCKFSVPVAEQMVLGVCEIIPCTNKAIKCIAEVKPWKA